MIVETIIYDKATPAWAKNFHQQATLWASLSHNTPEVEIDDLHYSSLHDLCIEEFCKQQEVPVWYRFSTIAFPTHINHNIAVFAWLTEADATMFKLKWG